MEPIKEVKEIENNNNNNEFYLNNEIILLNLNYLNTLNLIKNFVEKANLPFEIS